MLCLATKAWIGGPMNIIERARAFVESLGEQANRRARSAGSGAWAIHKMCTESL